MHPDSTERGPRSLHLGPSQTLPCVSLSFDWPDLYFLKDFIYLFLERGKGREKGRERNISVWLPLAVPPTGDLARNPGVCPDWESNRRPFGLQASTQSTEPHQPGLICILYILL